PAHRRVARARPPGTGVAAEVAVGLIGTAVPGAEPPARRDEREAGRDVEAPGLELLGRRPHRVEEAVGLTGIAAIAEQGARPARHPSLVAERVQVVSVREEARVGLPGEREPG